MDNILSCKPVRKTWFREKHISNFETYFHILNIDILFYSAYHILSFHFLLLNHRKPIAVFCVILFLFFKRQREYDADKKNLYALCLFLIHK